MSLFLEGREDNTRLKVEKSVYQYQLDPDGEHWIVRYDYLRYPEEPHPGAHVQIRGSLTETAVTPVRGTLERIHFPTGRVSIEAVIRMLVEQLMGRTPRLFSIGGVPVYPGFSNDDDRFPSCYALSAPPYFVDPRSSLQPYLRSWRVR